MNVQRRAVPLHEAILYIRWLIPPFVFLASAIHEVILLYLLPRSNASYPLWVPVVVYGITGSIVGWWGLGRLARIAEERERAKAELQAAYDRLSETHRQLLAMHDIGREIASAEDLQHVLEVAARAPISLTNARGSTVVTFDEESDRLHLDVAWGLSETYLEKLRERVKSGIAAKRCSSCNVLTAHVDGNCPLFAGLEDVAKADGIHSLACLPFGRGEKREGIITAYFPHQEGPPEDHLQALNIVATEIANAIESARLRDRHMEALYALEHLTEDTLALEPLLFQILDITLLGWNVKRGGIFLLEEGRMTSLPRVFRGLSNDPTDPVMVLAHNVARQSVRDGAPYIIPDTRLLPAPAPHPDDVRSVAAVPLLAGHETVGVLVMLSEAAGYFRAAHAPFFASIGYHAGLALNNTQLRSRLEHLAVLEERYRLSREIHDGLAQMLSVIGWRLDRAAMLLRRDDREALEHELEDIRQELRAAYLDVREAIDGLRMDINHPQGLVGALAEYVSDFADRTGIDAHFSWDGEMTGIPAHVGAQLLRIVQEGLTNVRKHAHARQVSVSLSRLPDAIELRIDDDGQGFDVTLPRDRSRVGLSSMRERVQKLHGEITIASQPGQGVHILVRVPLRAGAVRPMAMSS